MRLAIAVLIAASLCLAGCSEDTGRPGSRSERAVRERAEKRNVDISLNSTAYHFEKRRGDDVELVSLRESDGVIRAEWTADHTWITGDLTAFVISLHRGYRAAGAIRRIEVVCIVGAARESVSIDGDTYREYVAAKINDPEFLKRIGLWGEE